MAQADADHWDRCRNYGHCGELMPRSQMVKASRVLGEGRQGWYCPECARREAALH